jgi:hypothetical protein
MQAMAPVMTAPTTRPASGPVVKTSAPKTTVTLLEESESQDEEPAVAETDEDQVDGD